MTPVLSNKNAVSSKLTNLEEGRPIAVPGAVEPAAGVVLAVVFVVLK